MRLMLNRVVFLGVLVLTAKGVWASAPSGGHQASDESPASVAQAPPRSVDEAVLRRFAYLQDHSRVASKCLQCHEAQYKQISESIHGKAGLLKDFPAGTLCLTCHEQNHLVTDPIKIANFQLKKKPESESREVTCMRCHSDPTLAAEFNFSPHVPGDFEQTIHFRKAMLGEKRAPLCFDCHGSHAIVRVEAPDSPVRGEGKVKTCAKCHTGANAWFAESFDHTPMSADAKPIDYYVAEAFKILTLGTFLALGLYVLLDLATLIRLAMTPRHKRGYHHPVSEGEPIYVPRLNLVIRIQHFVMLFTVITLVVTGWPLLAPTSPISQSLMRALGGPRILGYIHRGAGILMILDFISHVIYLLYKVKQGHFMHPMFPMPRDIRDLWGMIQFFFGLKSERPKFAEFAFHEKFDYWAVFWGVPMLGVSGVILAFPVWATKFLPGISIRLSHIVHADEALLAAMVLFIWHFYNVHLKPGIFPMNWAWITGRLRKEFYEEEHAGHVEELKRQGKWPPS